ncbi:MAG: hypothetical protein ABJE47_02455 [bacterium]
MAFREFVDSEAVAWQVWEVIPQSVERRKLRDRRVPPRQALERRKRHEARLKLSDGEVDGWLVFESRFVKKRLRPIPHGWFQASETALESMCVRADRAPRTTPRLIE